METAQIRGIPPDDPRGVDRRRRHRWLLITGAAVLVAISMAGAWKLRYHFLGRNFRAITPGRIYAGGYQHSIPLARILQEYQIKTVLSLRSSNSSDERDEEEFLAARGVAHRRVAMDARAPISDGLALAEQAVQILADEQNQPLFVHCAGGMHRAGAVVGVYRVTHCGWSEEEALRELLQYADDSKYTIWALSVVREHCRRRGADADRHDEVVDAGSK